MRLRQLVDPVLSAGALLVASAQIPFTISDGRLRVAATTLDAGSVHAIVSGGYDIPADQADIRAVRRPGGGRTRHRPSGNPDFCRRFARQAQSHRRCFGVVVLACGAGDRSRNKAAGFDRARRAPQALPASIPPRAGSPPAHAVASAGRPGRVQRRDPRRIPLKPRVERAAPAAPNALALRRLSSASRCADAAADRDPSRARVRHAGAAEAAAAFGIDAAGRACRRRRKEREPSPSPGVNPRSPIVRWSAT